MRHLALAIAAIFTFALVAPAFAQPFADVPADHWAFDAIAELAAKGILEGYPDGTFKGDRAMTRYEMAMALARILARIEAIKIPPPPKIPPPEVRRADIDRLQRLINEFRAELSALGVRITAVEEELAALRARLDNTNITGDWSYIYMAPSTGLGPPTIGRNRVRLVFRGRLSPEFQLFLRVRYNASFAAGTAVPSVDRIRGDWATPWGFTWSGGLEYWSLGPQGLLLQIQANPGNGYRITSTLGGIGFTVLWFFNGNGTAPGFTATSGGTWAARAEFPIAGWTIGANYRLDNYNGTFIDTNTISGWSVDVQGTLVPGVSFLAEYAGWNWGSGWFFGSGCDTAALTGAGVPSGSASCSALFAQVTFDLAALAGMSQFAPVLNVYYKDYNSGVPVWCGGYVPEFYGGTVSDCSNVFNNHQGVWLGGDFRLVTAWGADLTLQLTPKFSVMVGYESGTVNDAGTFTTCLVCGPTPVTGFATGDDYTGLMARGTYTLSTNAALETEYFNLRNTTDDTGPWGTSGWAIRVRFSW